MQPTHHDDSAHAVRRIGYDAPLRWLKSGWQGLCEAPMHNLGWGLLFTIMGLILLALPWSGFHIHEVLVSGFLIMGPILTLAFYGASRRIENGEAVDSSCLRESLRRNPQMIAFFGLILAFTLSVWERLSAIVFAFFFISNDLPGGTGYHLPRSGLLPRQPAPC